MDITSTTNVCDQDKVEVRVAIDGEPYASLSTTGYPTKIKTQPEKMLLGNILQNYSTYINDKMKAQEAKTQKVKKINKSCCFEFYTYIFN